jgi:uncharacterized protein YutE (UPF0331/DUF86 family)
MDADLILDKLASLARCVQRLEDKRPAELSALLDDIDTQDILALNLERAVQLCVDIGAHVLAEHRQPAPETMGDVFLSLAKLSVLDAQLAAELRKAVGLRNVSVHAYLCRDRLGHRIRCRASPITRVSRVCRCHTEPAAGLKPGRGFATGNGDWVARGAGGVGAKGRVGDARRR